MKAGIVIIFLIALAVGVVAALGMMGLVDIPGLSPVKKEAAKAAKTVDSVTKQVEQQTKPIPKPTPKPKKDQPTDDPEQGARKLAKLWNEVETKKLIDLVKDWKDADVARVFSKMEPDKVAEVLGDLEPKRASKISGMIEKQASALSLPLP